MEDIVPDSIYHAITDNALERVLFVQHRREGKNLYLVGGEIKPEQDLGEALWGWVDRQLGEDIVVDGTMTAHGHWTLSEKVGGGKVYLEQTVVDICNPIESFIQESPYNGLVSQVVAFTPLEIHQRLYTFEDMHWGQAKMAIHALHHQRLVRPNGELLRDDLGIVGNLCWKRPSD